MESLKNLSLQETRKLLCSKSNLKEELNKLPDDILYDLINEHVTVEYVMVDLYYKLDLNEMYVYLNLDVNESIFRRSSIEPFASLFASIDNYIELGWEKVNIKFYPQICTVLDSVRYYLFKYDLKTKSFEQKIVKSFCNPDEYDEILGDGFDLQTDMLCGRISIYENSS